MSVDFEAQLERSGCFEVYEKMEACLGEFDRDWRACQTQVNDFKMCMKDKAINITANVSNATTTDLPSKN